MTVVLDCNIYISLVIKRQIELIPHLAKSGITIAYCNELAIEVTEVLSRNKFRRYLSASTVSDVLQLLRTTTTPFYLSNILDIVSDKKDNYLFALCQTANANYLVTGDKLLLEVKKYRRTEVITFKKFREMISNI